MTPALATEVTRQVAASDSVRAGRQALARRGIDLGHKQTLRIVGKVGKRLVEQREQWLARTLSRTDGDRGPLAGKRVFVSTDGGRCRMRIPAKSGRRRAKTGHRGYAATWQEPKLFVIYALDDQGRVEQSFQPVIDGTMGDCEVVFRMLLGYLEELGAGDAAELIFAADGALWIWERVDELASRLGIERKRVIEVIDWYHAVQTLHTIAAIPARWAKSKRDKWIRRAKKLLRAGRIETLVEHIRSLAIGRGAKKVLKHVGYFERNVHRMQYTDFNAANVPLGSGAMESAVRRVVNLRMKGNGKFWLRENAEAMLMLRSYLKAGRFDDLMDWSLAEAVPWWCPESSPLAPFRTNGGPSAANDNEVAHALSRAS